MAVLFFFKKESPVKGLTQGRIQSIIKSMNIYKVVEFYGEEEKDG